MKNHLHLLKKLAVVTLLACVAVLWEASRSRGGQGTVDAAPGDLLRTGMALSGGNTAPKFHCHKGEDGDISIVERDRQEK